MIINNDDQILFQHLVHRNLSNKNIKNEYPAIELIIRPECNQKCQYCYLQQHGKEIYPVRINSEQIINNLSMLINYFIEQEYIFGSIDLFAGDLFFDDLFFDLIPVFKTYYNFLKEKYFTILEENQFFIMIPCNMSFCENDEKITKVKTICDFFRREFHVQIKFSYSTDGIYATEIREQKQELNETFFDKVFQLCEEENWGVHPMISYEGIDKMIDNYEWFKAKHQQFTLKGTMPYFLEVRNDGWTDETIKKYQKFLIYVLDDIFHNNCQSNLDIFFNNVFSPYEIINGQYRNRAELNTNFSILHLRKNVGHFSGCSLSNQELIINLQNLSIVPCHRLAYPELIGGYFVVENQKITSITAAETINSYLSTIYCNRDVSPKCISCKYNPICMKGCLGAQYESSSDINIPCSSVCNLLQMKYNTIINYYHSIGLFHHIFQNYLNYPDKNDLLLVLLNFGYDEYKVYTSKGDKSYE